VRKGELVREKEGRNPPLSFVLTGVDHSHPYLVERGIDPATAVEFGVGFYARSGLLSGRIVIPIANARGQTVALMGSSLSAEQENALLGAFDHVILLLDGDAAGRAASRAITTRGTQPDQLSLSTIQQLLR
jgi:hypothetical protein